MREKLKVFPGCYMLGDICEVIYLSGPSDLNACDSFAVMSHFHGESSSLQNNGTCWKVQCAQNRGKSASTESTSAG